jgi:hypothetical protein
VFWRVFWWLRLLVAAGFTYWTWLEWDDYRDLVKLMMLVTIWTMWTSDLPDGREE